MSATDPDDSSGSTETAYRAAPHELPEHPVGTLAIVLVYGLLFALGWFAIYVFLFIARGAPTH
ncbi:MAG: hypothetical protein DWQ36_11075 [Acidobacteria bacterium]|nr:MAG: hypothetical protein DWQ30_12325 [Acidobacteriota bacterium]REK07752.1 MAG: hypothetical protein DWQ36_11075 [Acidobacteriota bacterium]